MWLAATQVHLPYTWGGLAKTLEDLGELDDAAHAYRQATAGPKPFPEACCCLQCPPNVDPALAAAAGQRALANGCPPSAELLSPTAVGLAITGRWEEAEGMAGPCAATPAAWPSGPAGSRRAPWGPRALRAAQQSGAETPRSCRPRSRLLDQAGEVEVAQPVRSPPRPTRPQRRAAPIPRRPLPRPLRDGSGAGGRHPRRHLDRSRRFDQLPRPQVGAGAVQAASAAETVALGSQPSKPRPPSWM